MRTGKAGLAIRCLAWSVTRIIAACGKRRVSDELTEALAVEAMRARVTAEELLSQMFAAYRAQEARQRQAVLDTVATTRTDELRGQALASTTYFQMDEPEVEELEDAVDQDMEDNPLTVGDVETYETWTIAAGSER